ncbi:MAG: hypothetical protein HY047_07585 [Acidobacteria bacterium]|nr:hypothetical protein [Acidobacteriota bacterium]
MVKIVIRLIVVRLLMIAAVALCAACSHDGPSSPSSPSPTSLAATSSASILRTSLRTSNNAAPATVGASQRGEDDRDKDEVEGVIAATTRSIVIGGTTVTVPSNAVIRHGHATLFSIARTRTARRGS